VPLPYDAALHSQAEQGKDYRSLIRETSLTTTTEGAWTLVSNPALDRENQQKADQMDADAKKRSKTE